MVDIIFILFFVNVVEAAMDMVEMIEFTIPTLLIQSYLIVSNFIFMYMVITHHLSLILYSPTVAIVDSLPQPDIDIIIVATG